MALTDTQTIVLNAALAVAERDGWHAITRDAVAALAGCSSGTVSGAFGGMAGLSDAVMQAAVERECLPVLAAGLVARHPAVRAAMGIAPRHRTEKKNALYADVIRWLGSE